MNRSDFRRGAFAGLGVGFAVGLLAALLVVSGEPEAGLPSDAEDLRRRLQESEEKRARTAEDLAEFQQLAEQMSSRFRDLERRFEALATQCDDVMGTPAPGP